MSNYSLELIHVLIYLRESAIDFQVEALSQRKTYTKERDDKGVEYIL